MARGTAAIGPQINEGKRVMESALQPEEWAYLCGFLQMDLQSVLKLTNRALLQAVDTEIARRSKKGLLDRILRPKSAG